MRRNPFIGKDDKFKILPSINSEKSRDQVARRLFWAYVGYWGTFILWLVLSHTIIPVVFFLGALMFIGGGIASIKLPTESGHIGRKTRFTILSYLIGLVAFKLVIYLVQDTPVELWEKTLQMDLPDAFANTFMGYLSMAFMIAMFMGFIGYLGYIGQLFMFHRSDQKTSDHIRKLMRKEDDNR